MMFVEVQVVKVADLEMVEVIGVVEETGFRGH